MIVEEWQPLSLLDVIEPAGATGFFAETGVAVFEGSFEHSGEAMIPAVFVNYKRTFLLHFVVGLV